MHLEELLRVMDRAAANLAKLQAIWDSAEPMIPSQPQRGTTREYEEFRRAWTSLLGGLPLIDGFTVTDELPDIDQAGQSFLDHLEIGEPPFALMNDLQRPGQQLDEYRFKLAQARRRAIRDRLDALTSLITDTVSQIAGSALRNSADYIDNPDTIAVTNSISEVERLLGDAIERKGRWGDLHRHLRFSQGHDWHDIAESDWPSVRADIQSAALSDHDPLPVPAIDLGTAASSNPAGAATIGLNWTALNDDAFERLLFDLLQSFPSYQNVEWLMKTRAPDRGRDLSAERVTQDDGGSTRIERVILQAKHWTTRSVAPIDIMNSLAALPTWEPPAIRVLVIATSGRFTADAVTIVEKHNLDGNRPFIELWADSRLETQLSQRPGLVATYGLRP